MKRTHTGFGGGSASSSPSLLPLPPEPPPPSDPPPPSLAWTEGDDPVGSFSFFRSSSCVSTSGPPYKRGAVRERGGCENEKARARAKRERSESEARAKRKRSEKKRGGRERKKEKEKENGPALRRTDLLLLDGGFEARVGAEGLDQPPQVRLVPHLARRATTMICCDVFCLFVFSPSFLVMARGWRAARGVHRRGGETARARRMS